MAKEGFLTRKPQKWFEKLLGVGPSWLKTAVAIFCICASIYVLHFLITEGQQERPDLEDFSGMPLVSIPPPLFIPRSRAFPSSATPTENDFHLWLSPEPSPVDEVELPTRKATDLTRIVFGIGAAAKSWAHRKQYITLWWRLNEGLRGFVWLDTPVEALDSELPEFRISALETSALGSGVRMFRIISETLRLELPDVDWLVMGDDDTVFFPENLVKVLSKYDHKQMFYVGSNSESSVQNLIYSYNMAFGGGGFAISYPLAKELASMEDDCLARYTQAYGSDDRIHACMSELGVALTKEPGFHQMDIHGNPFGLLAAHPVNPLVTLHHMDAVDAIFPGSSSRQEALSHLVDAAKVDQASLLQQSMCYCQRNHQIFSISVSWGYAVQIYKGYLAPRELEVPVRTFNSVLLKKHETEFSFNTREFSRGFCGRPRIYFLSWARRGNRVLESEYEEEGERWSWRQWACGEKMEGVKGVQRIRVTKEPVPDTWFQAPRRSCCQLTGWTADTIDLHLGACQPGQSIATLSPGWD